MARITTKATAVQWALGAARLLQQETLTVDEWEAVAEDLEAVAKYAQAKVEEAAEAAEREPLVCGQHLPESTVYCSLKPGHTGQHRDEGAGISWPAAGEGDR